MSLNAAATLALGVSTGGAASDLAKLTEALGAFKSALNEFNNRKVENPIRDLPASTSEVVAKLKTQYRELEDENKKLTNKLQAETEKRSKLDNQHVLRRAQMLVEAEKSANAHVLQYRAAQVKEESDQIKYNSKVVGDIERARLNQYWERKKAEADAVKNASKELRTNLNSVAASALADKVRRDEEDRKATELSDKYRYSAYWDRVKQESAAAKAANAQLQAELDRIAAQARKAATERGVLQDQHVLRYAQLQASLLKPADSHVLQYRAEQVKAEKLGPPPANDQHVLDFRSYQARTDAKERADQEAARLKHIKETEAATRRLASAQSDHTKLMNDAHSAARGLASGFNAMWLTWGNIVPLLAGAAISNGLIQATKAGAEFNYQLTFVKALGGETAEAVAAVGASALKLSKESLYGPVELANGLRMLSQAGLSASQAMEVLPTVTQLATVGEMSMAAAGKTLAGVMNAFNLQIKDFPHISDTFAKAAALSQTSVSEMTEAMKTASVVGAQYKVSMEDTATALTLLAKINITGTAAGTSLRNMLKELYTPTEGVAKVMSQIGLKAVDASGNLKPFADVIYDLKGKSSQYDQTSQVNILQKLFGERGAKEAVAMLSLTRDEWEKLRKSISDSEGFSKGVSSELENTFQGQWTQALNTMKVSLVQAYQEAEPTLIKMAQALKQAFSDSTFVEGLKTLLTSVASLTRVLVENFDTIVNVAKAFVVFKGVMMIGSVVGSATAALGGLLTVQTALAVATGQATTLTGAAGLTGAVRVLGGSLLGVLTPMGLIAGALAAGTVAWSIWAKSAEDASRSATKAAEKASKSFARAFADAQSENPTAAGLRAVANQGKNQLDDQWEAYTKRRKEIAQRIGVGEEAITGKFDASAVARSATGNKFNIFGDLDALKAEFEAVEKQRTLVLAAYREANDAARREQASASTLPAGKKVFSPDDRGIGSLDSAKLDDLLKRYRRDQVVIDQEAEQSRAELDAKRSASLISQAQHELGLTTAMNKQYAARKDLTEREISDLKKLKAERTRTGDGAAGEASVLRISTQLEEAEGRLRELEGTQSKRLSIDAIRTEGVIEKIKRQVEQDGRTIEHLLAAGFDADALRVAKAELKSDAKSRAEFFRESEAFYRRYARAELQETADDIRDAYRQQALVISNSAESADNKRTMLADAASRRNSALRAQRDKGIGINVSEYDLNDPVGDALQGIRGDRDLSGMTPKELAGYEGRIKAEKEWQKLIDKRRLQLKSAEKALEELTDADLDGNESALKAWQVQQDIVIRLRGSVGELTKAQKRAADSAENSAVRVYEASHKQAGSFSAFLANLNKNVVSQSDVAAAAYQGYYQAMEDSLVNFAMRSDSTWKQMTQSVLKQLMVMEAKIAASSVLRGILGLVSGMFTSTGSSEGYGEASNPAYTADVGSGGYWAKGGAFDSSGIHAFARGGVFTNAILSSPTLFRFAQGGSFKSGVMGEAGPEAVMPLGRDANGRLGVRAQGLGSGDTYQIGITINTESGQSKSQGDTQTKGGELAKKIEAVVRGVIVEEKRNGGLLAVR